MQQKAKFHPPLIAAVLAGLSLMMASPFISAHPVNESRQIPAKRAETEALSAAQRDFARFVSAHQGGARPDFPLDVKDLKDLKDATISYGFQVYTIDPSDLLAGRSTMRSMAKPVDQWRFVITLNQRAIGLATVEKIKGRYETVAYGAAVLAQDLNAAARHHGNADKSNLRFVRIYQARSDLLEVASPDGRGRFAPLHSARESLALQQQAHKEGKQGGELLDETELIQALRSAVKQNMAAPR
jgi:hypothetical protein